MDLKEAGVAIVAWVGGDRAREAATVGIGKEPLKQFTRPRAFAQDTGVPSAYQRRDVKQGIRSVGLEGRV